MTVARLSAKLLANKGKAKPSSYAVSIARFVGNDIGYGMPLIADGGRNGAAKVKKQVKKTLKLEPGLNRKLCLLAARTGMSQQQLMERAVFSLIEQVQEDDTCICLMS